MKRYLLTITLLGVCALSFAQEGPTSEEIKAVLSSMEVQNGPLFKDPLSTFGPSSMEELQLTIAERDDAWSQGVQEWSPRDSVIPTMGMSRSLTRKSGTRKQKIGHR